MDLQAVFEKYVDETYHFDRIAAPAHKRADICAFLTLSDIVPTDCFDIVASAHEGEIRINVDCEKLAAAATEEQIRDLIRCGVSFDFKRNALYMFV